MDINIQQTSYKFDFFNKQTKIPQNKVAWGALVIMVVSFVILLLLINMNTVSTFHEEIKQYQVYKNEIEIKSNPLLKELNISLQTKNWEVAQSQLMKLNELYSTQVNKDTIQILTDYATKSYLSKKQKYSNEFSLLIINYLNGMKTNPRKEIWAEISLQNKLDLSWSSDKSSMENLMKKEMKVDE